MVSCNNHNLKSVLGRKKIYDSTQERIKINEYDGNSKNMLTIVNRKKN